MNKNKVLYYFTNLMDFALTYGGTAAVIIYNYVSPDNSESFKITLSGVILVITLLLSAKTMFEHNYQNKQNSLLQQLGTTTDENVKAEINKKLDQHKMTNAIYRRLMVLLPFMIVYVITYLGAIALEDLNGTVGMILLSMGAGSIFNVVKYPLKDKAQVSTFEKKAEKKVKKQLKQ